MRGKERIVSKAKIIEAKKKKIVFKKRKFLKHVIFICCGGGLWKLKIGNEAILAISKTGRIFSSLHIPQS